MAAFQRGISLAEAEPERPDHGQPPYCDNDFPDGFPDESSKEEMHHGE